MSDVGPENLPAASGEGMVDVSVCAEGLLVGGDPEAVESYLKRLRATAGKTMRVVGVDTASLGNATGLLAAATTVLGQSGKFVQLHPDSINALKVGNVIPGTDGYLRMTTRSADGTFLQQLQWRPAPIAPPQLMALQMVAVQIALKSAIANVEKAVARVEGKVEAVLQLAEASRTGDVLGNNVTISRAIAFVEKHGTLPDADWDALAGIGPVLNVAAEQLRNHVKRTLEALDPDLPVQERAEKLRQAVEDRRLGETLSLLVVAEETLYKWQRLRMTRVEAKEPEQLQRVIDDARELLTYQLGEDGNLYRNAKDLLDEFAKPAAIEGFRIFSVRELGKQRSRAREELDAFAEARRHQVESWEDVETPDVLDAAAAVVEAARESTRRAIGSAGQGLIRIGERLTEATRQDDNDVIERPKPESD